MLLVRGVGYLHLPEKISHFNDGNLKEIGGQGCNLQIKTKGVYITNR